MAKVVLADSEARTFTDGLEAFEIEASTVARLYRALERRFPGLGDYVERRCAVVIDGEIHQDAHAERLDSGCEVCLIPRIGGG